MDNEPDEVHHGGGTGDLLRALDSGGRGDYKRALLLRFLRDQAKAVGHWAAADEDAQADSLDGGGGEESNHDLVAALRDADFAEVRSLNAQQLHRRRLQLNGDSGGDESGRHLPRRSPSARVSVARALVGSADNGVDGDDVDKSRLSSSPPTRLGSVRPPLLAAEAGLLSRGAARPLPSASAARAGGGSRGSRGSVNDYGTMPASPAPTMSRMSPESPRAAAATGPLLASRKRYDASSSSTAGWIAAASTAAADGGDVYRAAEGASPVQARGSSLVRLPALIRQPGVSSRALDGGGAARFAGLNKAA